MVSAQSSAMSEGVFYDLRLAEAIHQRHIEAHFSQATARLRAQKFLRAPADAAHLRRAQRRGGTLKVPALLDLDKNQTVPVPNDQINLTGFPAPSTKAR
jgi:hypothetical protein